MNSLKNDERIKRKNTSEPDVNIVKDVMSFREALAFMDMSASTLYKKTHKREIRFFKPNGKIYFLKQDLINYMLSNRRESLEEFENETNKYLNRESHE